MMTLDELIERKRQLGLTNNEVAEISGVPLSTVQKVFGGTTSAPRRSTLEVLSEALKRDPYADIHLDSMVAETEFAYGPKMPGKKRGTYTVKDYVRESEEKLVELIDGEIYDMCVPSLDHQNVVLEMAMQLRKCIDEKCKDKCKLFISPAGVQIDSDDYSVLVPDLFVSCDKDKWHGKMYKGAPDFVVEVVSPSSGVRDRIVKLNKYWHAGVREYWIVDPDKRIIEVNVFGKNELGEVYSFDDRVPVDVSDGKCGILLKDL